VGSEGSKRRFSVSCDLGEDLVGRFLEERRGLEGDDQSSSLLEGLSHSVVVSGALSISSGSLFVSIIGVSKIIVGLSELFLFTILVGLIGILLKIQVWEVSFTLSDLFSFGIDLIFVGLSGGIARVILIGEVGLSIRQCLFSLLQ